MSIVQKNYFVVQSRIDPDYKHPNPPSTDPPQTGESSRIYLPAGVVAEAKFPDWFTNANMKYKKIVRVLGASVNMVETTMLYGTIEPISSDFRIFSNIASHSNITMKTDTPDPVYDVDGTKLTTTYQTEGFVMMVNNYNSVKEYDITYENMREVHFYLRPWNSLVTNKFEGHAVDFVCELELLLVDES